MDQHSFFFQAMVYLAAAVIMVPVAKKLGLGSVLGYLLAGVIIGPAALKFIGEEGQSVMHFAEFGVVIMLFVVGLELEPNLLWRMRRSILGLGGLQVVITGLIIAAIAFFFMPDWKQALALGFTLAMSSTAIVLQTLNEKGLMKTAAGQSSFSVLLFQDIAVIPLLALFPLLAMPGGTEGAADAHQSPTLLGLVPGWAQPLVVLACVAAIIAAGRFLVRPLLRMVARTRMRELFTATALLLVVGIAVLMTAVGLSPALGTFLAGVVLADSEYRHELESDIDPFKGLLLGLFFMAVGASVDFSLIMQKPLLVFGLVAGIMAVKGAVLFVLGKLFKLSFDQNAIFGFGLSQVGEFAFVLFSFTLQKNILPKETVDIMVAVVAISMGLTPLLNLVNEKLILPRFGNCKEALDDEREADVVDEENPVIIAGFGHFGSTAGRFLRAHDIGTTVLDVDSDNVDRLRRMGFKVYYGDASRHDLLEVAGAAKARLIIIAIGDEEKRMEVIETVKKHFPNLRMLVRAANRNDAYDLMNAGMLHIYRESIDTSLRLGVDAMRFLGFRAYTAERAARIFFKYDEQKMRELSAIRDEDEYIIAARKNIEDLEHILQADKMSGGAAVGEGWDDDSLVADAGREASVA